MCGINIIIKKNQKPQLKEISLMNSAIKHRGPDDDGILSFENILLGHVRLSIQDLTNRGSQPMSVDGRYWIIFNGEIYNFNEIKKKLIKIGYKFYSHTDTEVILNAFKEWGVSCFDKFNGMWCFAILDKVKKTVIISRDRYGVKPCYFSKLNDKFFLSSEIKGILCTNTDYKLNKDRLLLDDKTKEKCFITSYENIDIIQPGFYYEVGLESIDIKKFRWWNGLDNIPKTSINKKIAMNELKEKLISATELRLLSDAKIGTSLSGGLDSSVIFSILNNINTQTKKINLNPFIVNYKKNKTFQQAKDLTSFYQKEPIIIEYKEDENIDNLSEILSSIELTEVFMGQYMLYKKQKESGIKVSIDGHGADESLAGYKSNLLPVGIHYQNHLINLYSAIKEINPEYLTKTIQQQNLVSSVQYFNVNSNSELDMTPSKNKYLNNNNFKLDIMPDSLKEDLITLSEYSIPFRHLYLNSTYGHMQWLLNKWDKTSMAHSIEIRSPFLDWNVFQYSLALPSEFKFDNGQNKSILREVFKNELPDSINKLKIKQGLPKMDIKINNYSKKIIEETIHDEGFKNNTIWDGRKIIKDFKDTKDINDINAIWDLTKISLMDKGFKNRKKNINMQKLSLQEKYNLLK